MTNEQGTTLVHHLKNEFVELNKLLKFEGLVNSGAEAKLTIDEGVVKVNGQVELRRRKKLFAGDTVEFLESRLQIAKQK